MINIKALDDAIEWAADIERQKEVGMLWNQVAWWDEFPSYSAARKKTGCGTYGCIAGNILHAAGYTIDRTGLYAAISPNGERAYSVPEEAKRVVLGDDTNYAADELMDLIFSGRNSGPEGLARIREYRDELATELGLS